MTNIKYRLNNNTSVNDINKNIKTNINFISKYKELPYNEISEIVNAYDVFNKERNVSKKYRIISTIRLLSSNPLMEVQGEDSLVSLDKTMFRNTNPINDNDVTDSTDLTYQESYKTYLKEVDGWFGYYDPRLNVASKCKFVDFNPKRTDFEIVNSADTNWYFYVTYPHSIDDQHILINGGILIIGSGTGIVGSIDRLILKTPIKHNLIAGNKVKITGTNDYDGEYDVLRIGDDKGNFREYIFVIDLAPNTININEDSEIRMQKIYLGEPSKYYFRKFKTITENNDYEVYNLGYCLNIYGDKVSQLVFNGGTGNDQEINIDGLTDNLNRPLSELYITAIKGRPSGVNKTSFSKFSNIKSGLNIPFIGEIINFTNVPDIRRIHNVGGYDLESHIPLEMGVSFNQTIFYGDVVEYNRLNLKEHVLNEVNHRFNLINRDNVNVVSLPNSGNFEIGPRPEGYIYKPHHKFEIRRYSNYIEFGDDTVTGIPDYATNVGNERYIWRDLLSLGFNDGSNDSALDYPFVNGVHYLYSDILLNIRRQDPFGEYGLYYGKFPKDPYGDRLNINNLDVNQSDYVC